MIVLDTHVWVWWVSGQSDRLSRDALELLEGSDSLGVSIFSCIEVGMLQKKGRIEIGLPLEEWFDLALEGSGVACLQLTTEMVCAMMTLPEIHSDPADRAIIATAMAHDARLITKDGLIQKYPMLRWVW